MNRSITLYIITFVCILSGTNAWAQVGGKEIMPFLNNTPSASISALGGSNVSLYNRDINMFMANPALLNEQMKGFISLNTMSYYAKTQQHSFAYGCNIPKAGMFATGLQFFDYNKFKETDESGNETGQFSALDYAYYVAHSRKSDNFTFGTNLKFAGSRIGSYSAFALLADAGAVFKHPTTDFSVGLTIRNMGVQLKKFDDEKEPLPLDVQLGSSFKFKHMPFRFSVTAHHLHQFDIVFMDTSEVLSQINDTTIKAKKTFGDKLARHFIVGGELLIGKNLSLIVSYNHMRRKEMRTDTRAGLAGFSFGILLKLKEMEIAYGKSYYAVRGSTNNITLSYNLSSLFKKKITATPSTTSP